MFARFYAYWEEDSARIVLHYSAAFALLLVLLAHPDHLAKNLDVEAISFCFQIDFLLGFSVGD